MQEMNTLAEIIRAEAAQRGVLTFARFMELALYHPELGYYETQKHSPGRRGDFYTSVSTGELFGHLLAFQFSEWLAGIKAIHPQIKTLHLIEAGAHDGTLASDILKWLQSSCPELFAQIEYRIIEPSTRRQTWQKETLRPFASRVRWFPHFNDLPALRSNGIIFSNELLDAFPVHRFGWDAKRKTWFEWGVAVERGKFIWARMPEAHDSSHIIRHMPSLPHLPVELMDVLPDGYTIEASPSAEKWWRQASGVLDRGWVMTFDYGLTSGELFLPGRAHGSLRSYSRHRASDDLLANAGEQDITAHVNFSAIRNAGQEAGLITEFFGSQAEFLVEILANAAKTNALGEWDSARTRQFQTLTHPDHLGRAFRALVQTR